MTTPGKYDERVINVSQAHDDVAGAGTPFVLTSGPGIDVAFFLRNPSTACTGLAFIFQGCVGFQNLRRYGERKHLEYPYKRQTDVFGVQQVTKSILASMSLAHLDWLWLSQIYDDASLTIARVDLEI